MRPLLGSVALLTLLSFPCYGEGAPSNHPIATATQRLRPVFTPEREFQIKSSAPVTEIKLNAIGIRVFAFNDALDRCGLNANTIQSRLNLIFDSQAALWPILDLIFSNSRREVESKSFEILIDDFSEFGGPTPVFASYFLPQPSQTIGLDCSNRARAYWNASIAHEITHLLFSNTVTESWWEEGVAQLLEREAGGMQPELSLRYLESSAGHLPNLLETRRPLPSRESYAVSFLMLRFIRDSFGGWPILRAMNPPGNANINTSDPFSFFNSIVSRAVPAVRANSKTAKLNVEKMTVRGILRFFYASLALGRGLQSSRYQIANWRGFSNVPGLPNNQTLAPGQAALFSASKIMKSINSNLETYRLLMDANGNLKILGPQPDAPTNFQNHKEVIVCINMTSAPQILFTGWLGSN